MTRFAPLMFGPASRQLFGVFHPAEEDRAENTAVLLCPPFGQEGLRTHRFFKVLAERLSRAGIATLRFDFYGSGDSPGDENEGEFDGWRRDLCSAHEELRRRAPGAAIVWVGARLGATLAV
ncbi:serine aminopeptidase domain-containing protein, partial [Variovorax sp. Varisp62]|uniref:serine aminopeptidase domain-containing protein n=1 Tax=Variovorax sp. Varisp62 TaxID=3243049 RepID=UPI0039B59982